MTDKCFAGNYPEVKARLWDYTSICHFQDPTYFPKRIFRGKNTKMSHVVTRSCEDDEKNGHPSAILISFKNTSKNIIETSVLDFRKVTVITKTGKKLSPAGLWWIQPNMMGGVSKRFVTDVKIEGKVKIKIEPDQTAELIYFFQDCKKGDSLKYGEMNPVIIK
jgi:hypothetical protein